VWEGGKNTARERTHLDEVHTVAGKTREGVANQKVKTIQEDHVKKKKARAWETSRSLRRRSTQKGRRTQVLKKTVWAAIRQGAGPAGDENRDVGS